MTEFTARDLNLGDYESEYTVQPIPLGVGGYGVVFEVRENYGESRKLVLKVATDKTAQRRQTFSGKEYLSIADMESRLLSKLQERKTHPNIVRLHGSFKAHFCGEEVSCLVLEFCHEGDLEGGIAAGNNRQDIKTITISMVSALAWCEENGVLHLDVKPANILIKRESRNALSFKLSDFGLGHVVMNRDNLSSLQVAGTPKYTSPELVSGDMLSASSKSDVWSLGVTLRAVVFQGNKVDIFKLMQRPGLFDIDYTVFSDISLEKAVAEAINSMLKIDPDHRPLASQIMKNLEVLISCRTPPQFLGLWAHTIYHGT
jgi:serine/threonine protein kinase